jgi:hypothetical protein
MLPMSFEPPLVRGTTWSVSSAASVSPQARHLLPKLAQSSLNSSAAKLPEVLPGISGVPRPDVAGLPWISRTERIALTVLGGFLARVP